MIDHGIVESTVKPEPMKIDDYSVWISTDIVEFVKNADENGYDGYSYHLVQYDKDEYIRLIQEQNTQETKQNRADIDYLALMTDIDLA